jgi:hypothetical protein
VVPSIVAAAAQLYAQLGVPAASLRLVANVPAGHALVTMGVGAACEKTVEPYIADCDYDQAGALLTHILGPLRERAVQPAGEFLAFDQREFVRERSGHGLADAGVLYVPRACRATPGCRVHVAFHGCGQHRGKIGDAFVRDTGFVNWADANRLLVLFPQVASSTINPQACWDWWGYTGRDYLTRSGVQIAAVRAMLERLAARPSGRGP